jgi:hypothetical protein
MPLTLVLPETATRDAIDDAIAQTDLKLTNLVRESASHPRQIVASSAAGFATFVEDARLGVRYVVVDGSAASEIASRLESRLGAVSWADVEARAESATASERAWALRYAVAFHTPERAAPLLVRGLTDADLVVRRVALLASAYALTPAVRGALALRAKSENDGALRHSIEALLAGLGQPS